MHLEGKMYTDLKTAGHVKIVKRKIDTGRDDVNGKRIMEDQVMVDQKIYDQTTGVVVTTHSKQLSLSLIDSRIANLQAGIDGYNQMKADFNIENAKVLPVV